MKNKLIYVPYIPKNTGCYINGVKVSDYRWYVNIFCKINWFFHFKLRKEHKKWLKTKVPSKYYKPITVIQ